jgi:tetratricopeptide (TPR) repeat protein
VDKPLQDILDQNEAAWQKLRFTIASYESAALLWVNADTDIKLQNIHRAIQSDFPTRHHISIHLPPDGNIKPFAQYIISKAQEQAQTGGDTIVHIWGIDRHLTKEKQLLNQLNFERETLFRQLPFVAIVYANTNSALKVQRHARDFWDWLVNYFEFQTTPEELSSRQKLLKDFVWLSDNSSLRIYDKDPAARIDQLKDELTQYQIGRKTDRIAILIAIAQEYDEISDYPSVIAYFKEAIDLCGDEVALADQKMEAQNELGEVLQLIGNLDEALSYFQNNLVISQQISDRKGEGMTLNNISQIYAAKGDYDTALPYLEQSLAIQQQIGDRSGEGTTLNNLAAIVYYKGDYDTSLRYLEQSLIIRQLIGDRSGEGTTLNNISQIYDAKGDYDTALRYLEQSLIIRQLIGDRSGEGVVLNNISQIYDAKNNYDTALHYLEQSLVIQQQIGDIVNLATTLNNMGCIFWEQQQDTKRAVACFIKAYQIFKQIGSPNTKKPKNWLNIIHKAIGAARYEAIVSGLGGV